MELRKLNTNDIFKMTRMIRKIGLDGIKEYIGTVSAAKLSKAENIRDLGADIFIDLLSSIIEKLPDIENELCAFIGDICGKNAKEIEALPPAETVDIIYEIAHKEEFGDFFTAVSRFFAVTEKKKAK